MTSICSSLPGSGRPMSSAACPPGSSRRWCVPCRTARCWPPCDLARTPGGGGERILIRVITYTITDPTLPGFGEEHRVITTLLNPRVATAHAVACAYHERWEIEIVID